MSEVNPPEKWREEGILKRECCASQSAALAEKERERAEAVVFGEGMLARAEAAEAEVKALQRRAQELVVSLSIAEKAAEAKLAEQAKEIERLRDSLKNADEALRREDSRYEGSYWKQRVGALEARERELVKELEVANIQIKFEQNNLQAQYAFAEEERAKVASLQTENSLLTKAVEDLKRVVATDSKELRDLCAARDDLRARNRYQEKMIDDMRANVERADKETEAAESRAAELQRAIEAKDRALQAIADPQCGCRPKCQCLEPESLRIFREWARETAQAALSPSQPQAEPYKEK